jgi:hypothetical protein
MNWGWKRNVALCAVTALFLAGCTSNSHVATLVTIEPKPVAAAFETPPNCARADGLLTQKEIIFKDTQDAAFAGVLRATGEDSPKGKRRYIFHTHGMGMTDACEGLIDPLNKALKARGYRSVGPQSAWLDAPTTAPHHIRGEALPCGRNGPNDPNNKLKPCLFTSFGQYRVDRFKGPGDDEVVVYSYFWHGDLWRVQFPFVQYDLAQKPGLFAKPAKEIVDAGLGDAAAYLGEMGVPLREGMANSICTMLREAGRVQGPVRPGGLDACLTDGEADAIAGMDDLQISFISHSLGSRMLFDVLGNETKGGERIPRPAQRALATRTDTFFMAANQLPLLGPGRVRRTIDAIEVQDRDTCGALPNFLAYRCAINKLQENRSPKGARSLEVIGFVDPGDLLGFRANGGIIDGTYPGVRFIAVRHRNAPQILWLGTWPTEAHDQELNKPSALALFLCGGVEVNGKLKPRACGAP